MLCFRWTCLSLRRKCASYQLMLGPRLVVQAVEHSYLGPRTILWAFHGPIQILRFEKLYTLFKIRIGICEIKIDECSIKRLHNVIWLQLVNFIWTHPLHLFYFMWGERTFQWFLLWDVLSKSQSSCHIWKRQDGPMFSDGIHGFEWHALEEWEKRVLTVQSGQQNYATTQAPGMRFSMWKNMKECLYRRLHLSFWHQALWPEAQHGQVHTISDQARGCTRGSDQRTWNSNCFYSISKYLPSPARC